MNQNGSEETSRSILVLSRGTAIILLLLYVLYLVFQLRTHSNLFDAENQASAEHEPEEPSLGALSAAAVLVVVTVLVAICAEYLVGSIDDLVESANISKSFIGLILIPIVGNAAEHVTAVVVAMRDKMDLAMGVAIGSSIQIALGVTPFLVIVGWIINQPMTLHFETCKSCRARHPPLASADEAHQSKRSPLPSPSWWSRTRSRTASPTTSKAPCCSASTPLLPLPFTPRLPMRWTRPLTLSAPRPRPQGTWPRVTLYMRVSADPRSV